MGDYDDLLEFAKTIPEFSPPEPEQPKQLPPTEDERLGIDTPLASPRGIAWDPHAREFRHAARIGKPAEAGVIPEQPLIREDPAMNVATTMAGAGAGKAVGSLLSEASPIAAKIVEPAVASATTSYLQHPGLRPTQGDLVAGGLGASLGALPAGIKAIKGAPAAVTERLPTAVTGGLKTKAAKQVVMGGAAEDVLAAHPELKKVLSTAGNVGTKFNATNSTIAKLTSANDVVYDAIQAAHGGVPVDALKTKLQALVDKGVSENDEVLEGAAKSAMDNLDRLAKPGPLQGSDLKAPSVVTSTQVRGARNNMARRVQALNPTIGPTEAEAAADEVRKALSEGIQEIAGKTPGVDVKALAERDRHIAELMPVKRTLREQAVKEKLLPPDDALADFIESLHNPAKVVAGLTRSGPAHIDSFLADRPALQDFINGVSPESVLNRGSKTPFRGVSGIPQRVKNLATPTGVAGVGANALKPTPQQVSERAYTTKILQYLDANPGASMQAAIDSVKE